jgi:hypothetical protein
MPLSISCARWTRTTLPLGFFIYFNFVANPVQLAA